MRNKYEAFVSYSHNDENIVRPLIQTLEATRQSVFVDYRDIQPSDNWPKSLKEALKRSRIVFVFWCCDSAESAWVEKEIKWARKQKKRLLPLLLCSYPPSRRFSDIQWIDYRSIVNHPCGHKQDLTTDITVGVRCGQSEWLQI